MSLRTRTIQWEDPQIGASKAQQMSGLEYLEAIRAGEIPAAPISQLVEMGFESLENGKVVFTFQPAEYYYNPIGSVHGGVIATLLDSAMGCAVHSTLPAGKGYTTLEFKINYLKSVTQATPLLYAVGLVLNKGSRTALVEAKLQDAEGKVYAQALGTCLML
ncbi:MAG TPA: aromatic compound degradation protein PaaI [Microscillaceae bacterium]|nr:aromatic compound degradation protein PaaI [Microscillaceae bacterium]